VEKNRLGALHKESCLEYRQELKTVGKRYKVCLLGRPRFLEILMRGHFPKADKAAAEGPKSMMVLPDTVALPFGHSCPDLGAMCNRQW